MRDEKIYKNVFKTWYPLLKDVVYNNQFDQVLTTLNGIYASGKAICPSKKDVFKPFNLTDYSKVHTVILCNAPYPNEYSTGLAWANPDDSLPITHALNRIMNVIEEDFYEGLYLNPDYTLENWAKQGVLLLNTSLTCEKNKSEAHKEMWIDFTKALLRKLSSGNKRIVFCLWGNQLNSEFRGCISPNNDIIQAEHPMAAFLDGRSWSFRFKTINDILRKRGIKMNW